MPMLVVNDSDFDLEIARLSAPNIEVVKDIKHGRGNKVEVSEEVRKQIASEALAGIDVDDIAREYNISKSSISAYKNGATSTSSYNNPDKELKDNNDKLKLDISERAQRKILASLNLLDDDKIASCKARDIAGIAKDLSTIVRNTQPEILNQQNNQVVIFRPRMKEEDDYDVIDITS